MALFASVSSLYTRDYNPTVRNHGGWICRPYQDRTHWSAWFLNGRRLTTLYFGNYYRVCKRMFVGSLKLQSSIRKIALWMRVWSPLFSLHHKTSSKRFIAHDDGVWSYIRTHENGKLEGNTNHDFIWSFPSSMVLLTSKVGWRCHNANDCPSLCCGAHEGVLQTVVKYPGTPCKTDLQHAKHVRCNDDHDPPASPFRVHTNWSEQ